jgi:hypothetical protein
VDLYLDQQAIDTTTPMGKPVFQVTGAFAEFERTIFANGGNAAGRMRGSRNRLSQAVICALLRDFSKHGEKAIAKVRRTQPAAYLKILALLVPRHYCTVWLGLAWAWLGKVDIIASAAGKIIPSGRTKIIQPFETGVVRAIHVRDGQSVKAGEALIELDLTMNEAERNHLCSDLVSAQLDVARLRAALRRRQTVDSIRAIRGMIY